MAIKGFSAGEVLGYSDVNTYLNYGGLVYVTEMTVTAGGTNAISINGCFSNKYDNYRIMIDGFQPSATNTSILMRMRVGGVDDSSVNYYSAFTGLFVNGTSGTFNENGLSYGNTGIANSTNTLPLGTAAIDVFAPYKAERTFWKIASTLYSTNFATRDGVAVHNVTTSYDGFTLLTGMASNFTKIRIKVYGYRQS